MRVLSAFARCGLPLYLRLAFEEARGQPAVNANDIAIIDCHQHLWDLTKFKVPWIKPGSLLGRSFVMKDYLEAIAGTGRFLDAGRTGSGSFVAAVKTPCGRVQNGWTHPIGTCGLLRR